MRQEHNMTRDYVVTLEYLPGSLLRHSMGVTD